MKQNDVSLSITLCLDLCTSEKYSMYYGDGLHMNTAGVFNVLPWLVDMMTMYAASFMVTDSMTYAQNGKHVSDKDQLDVFADNQVYPEWGGMFTKERGLQRKATEVFNKLDNAGRKNCKSFIVVTAGNDMRPTTSALELHSEIVAFKAAWANMGITVIIIDCVPGLYRDINGQV